MWADTSLISVSVLLLVLRHFCYMGRHDISVTWAGTYSTSVLSDKCFGTPASATALLLRGQARIVLWNFLISASVLLLVVRHFYCVGRHVSD